MKKFFKFTAAAAALALVLSGCQQELSTDQFSSEPTLSAFAPNPVYRGGEITFIGSYLEDVKEVKLPGIDAITEIKVIESGEKSRISVVLPNTSEGVGKIVLVTKDGKELTSKADLTYTEPVEFADFTPKNAMPGDVITITGDYMNLIKEVIFEGPSYVTAITDVERHSLKVVVPADAITGKLVIGDTDEVADPDNVANKTYSEAVLTIGDPTVTKAAEKTLKAGDKITITGAYLNMIKEVVFEGVTVTDFTVSKDNKSLELTLPATAKSGAFQAVSYAGKAFEAGSIVAVTPAGLSASPAPVKAGKTLTISGSNLDLVTKVNFPGAADVVFDYANGKITATVPATATEGDIELVMSNDDVVTVAYTLVAPAVTAVAPTELKAGEEIVITGTDLDLISSVTLGGKDAEFEVKSETELVVKTANTSVSGKLVLTLENGTTVTPEQTITLSYDSLVITTTLPASAPIMSEVVLTGANFMLVENIFVGDQKVTAYTVRKDDEVRFLMPDQKKTGVYNIYYHLFSGDVEQCPSSIEVTLQEDIKVIWEGNVAMGGWANSMGALSWGGYDWSTVKPGTRISMFFDVDPSVGYINIRFGNGSWSALPTTRGFSNADGDGNIVPDAGVNCISFELSAADLDQLVNAGGLVMCGAGYNVTKITLTTLIPKERVIWEGSVDMGGWANSMGALSWGGYDWASVPAGTYLIAYFTLNPGAEYYNVRFGNGSWAALPSTKLLPGADGDGNLSPTEGTTRIEFCLTDADLDQLVNAGGLVMCGGNYTLTSVALL